MDKRFQVFVSSTFEDLKDERQAVLRAILELDHIPAGMELFPAADDDAWQLIRDVIDASDYYLLIVGGRYGSMDELGISYTEKEYEYAVASRKPVIPVLHKNPDNLPRDRTETDKKAWKKLLDFRGRIQKAHTCASWLSTQDLKASVIVGITSAIKRNPAVGWVRSDRVPSSDTVQEILALRNRVAELETSLASASIGPPAGAESLAQGDETLLSRVYFSARKTTPIYPYHEDEDHAVRVKTSWDKLFASVAPCMIDEAKDADVRERIGNFFESIARGEVSGKTEYDGRELIGFGVTSTTIDTCIVQLRALGLIRQSDRKRSVKDAGTFWTLSPYGDRRMVQLRALKRKAEDTSKSGPPESDNAGA
jgi:hypothetical protein